jgi:hypothetical protein
MEMVRKSAGLLASIWVAVDQLRIAEAGAAPASETAHDTTIVDVNTDSLIRPIVSSIQILGPERPGKRPQNEY